MTQYLLDTDTFIFLLKHEPSVEAKALAEGMPAIAASVVTAAEVIFSRRGGPTTPLAMRNER